MFYYLIPNTTYIDELIQVNANSNFSDNLAHNEVKIKFIYNITYNKPLIIKDVKTEIGIK